MRRRVNKSIKYLYVFISVILIIGIFMFGSYMKTGKISTVLKAPFVAINATAKFTKGIGSNIGGYFWGVGNLNNRNNELKKTNEDLNMQLLETNKLKQENDSLREMLNIKERYEHFNLVYSDVIIRDINNLSENFVINKGTKNGISPKMAVVTKDGLVGYTTECSEYTSKIATILDPMVSVSVQLGTSKDTAVCKGDFHLKEQNKIKMMYIPIKATVTNDDIISTSGLGGIFPRAIPVGKISEVKSDKFDMDRYAVIEPSVDILNVREVAVIIN